MEICEKQIFKCTTAQSILFTMKKILFLLFFMLPMLSFAQSEYAYETFKSTKIVNTQSIETLQKGRLDVRIGHRFGDMFGDGGGWATFYGFEVASDILTGFAYGITDNTTIGISRTKGASSHKMLVNAYGKYRFLHQKTNGMPITLTFFGNATMSTMNAVPIQNQLASFSKFSHRFSYTGQILIARKFSDRFSLQITPSYVHRNIVDAGDANGLFSAGIAGRIGLNKHHAILLDLTVPFSNYRTTANGYYMPFGIGWEIDTGGHRFQLNLTNATGMIENDYIPNTKSNWSTGGFRLGFTISRWFNLKK